MQRAHVHVILLVLFTILLSSCGGSSEQQKPEINLNQVFPESLPIVNDTAWRFDIDGDGRDEWLVLYLDRRAAGTVAGSPTIGAVYRSVDEQDSRLPPSIVPALLWVPSQGYVCLRACQPVMMNAISDVPGDELVILDKQGDVTVGAVIFRWQGNLGKKPDETCLPPWYPMRAACVRGGFVPLGHFRGDSVVIDPQVADTVTVIHKHYDRSDLATKEVYYAKSGHYYVQEVRTVYDPGGQLRRPDEAEIIFATGPPQEPTKVKLPEKLVLSFYANYNNVEEIQNYFAADSWKRVGQDCANGVCGCSFDRKDVARVMVKQIAYESDFKPTTQVVVQVICINKQGQREASANRVWTLNSQNDGTWRLTDVTVGGEEFLCPQKGCVTVGGGE
jgi:hypothetical protein